MPERQETFKARTILEHASSSVTNFLAIYDALMGARPQGGAPSDQDQDILRAALVFAASGLDSALKELIRSSVKPLAQKDEGVQREFETFIQRQLRGDAEESDTLSGIKFLANILASSSPQSKLLNEYVFYLTGASLQSVEQLFKTVKALGIETKFLAEQKVRLNTVFEARNKIIHELDVKFTGKQGHRHRNIRRRTDIEEYSNTILKVAETVINEVEKKLDSAAS